MALELKTRDGFNVNDIRTWPNNVAIIKKPEKREKDPLVEEEVIKAILQHYPQLGVFEADGHLFLEIRKPPTEKSLIQAYWEFACIIQLLLKVLKLALG